MSSPPQTPPPESPKPRNKTPSISPPHSPETPPPESPKPKRGPKTPSISPSHSPTHSPPSSPKSPKSPKKVRAKHRPVPHKVETMIEQIDSSSDAFHIAKQYITKMRQYYDGNTNDIIDELFETHTDPVPRNALSTRWRMTEDALNSTLNYIYNKLSHTCYMLCIANNKKKIYKLSSMRISPSFQQAIQAQLLNIDKNNLITDDQKKYIKEFSTGPIRIMQCILKHYNFEQSQTDNEYLTLLNDVIIPDGVYILNLTDAVILHNHNNEPFPSITGNKQLGYKYDKSYYIPILSLSGQKQYSDIPIPNYDDVQIVLNLKDLKAHEYITSWKDKKIHKAIFRGGPAGCGYTLTTNQRLNLLSIRSPLIDAKIVSKTPTIDSKAIKFDPKYGIGMKNTNLKPGSFVSMKDQSNYKYIIHVDGNVNAYCSSTRM